MTGDPVEEGGQAVRQGFIQAMQTAPMMLNLMQRRNSELRSIAEFDRRAEDAAIRRHQAEQIHDLKVTGYHTRATQGEELHAMEIQVKRRQIARGDADLARRANADRLDRADKDELHTLQTEWHERREQRAAELHQLETRIKRRILDRGDADEKRRGSQATAERGEQAQLNALRHQQLLDRARWEQERHDLDVEYKRLLIDIRRRQAGFTETLTTNNGPDTAAAMHAAAAYAAAHSAADVSDPDSAAADAYDERLTEDTGTTAEDILDAEIVDLDPRTRFDTVGLDAIAGLTDELAAETYLLHLVDPADSDHDHDPRAGIAAAVAAAGLHDLDPHLGLGAENETDTPAAVDLDRDLGPGAQQ
ncbi:hypothetical protein [Nocardia blacklockiae]|uniref:hypothetical protein n=1 Tax=Nocardia blacklockiae TaxID=480036 RepID=UPI001895E5FF|nr:hypothetical protein [Nocardia blacklockiae]MBF6176043.1 hypothetical protein [Nocardia blacklockiae]